MAKVAICQKPTCTTCRQTMTIMNESGVDFEAVNYYIDPIPKKKLKELMRKMKLSARDPLRTKEPIYKELKLDEREVTEGELLGLMVKRSHGDSCPAGKKDTGDTVELRGVLAVLGFPSRLHDSRSDNHECNIHVCVSNVSCS